MWEALRVKKGEVHIFPLDDLEKHLMTDRCRCKPKERSVYTGVMYTHNSYDGREAYELVEKKGKVM